MDSRSRDERLKDLIDAVLHLFHDWQRLAALELACRRSGAVPPGMVEKAEMYLAALPDDSRALRNRLRVWRAELDWPTAEER